MCSNVAHQLQKSSTQSYFRFKCAKKGICLQIRHIWLCLALQTSLKHSVLDRGPKIRAAVTAGSIVNIKAARCKSASVPLRRSRRQSPTGFKPLKLSECRAITSLTVATAARRASQQTATKTDPARCEPAAKQLC